MIRLIYEKFSVDVGLIALGKVSEQAMDYPECCSELMSISAVLVDEIDIDRPPELSGERPSAARVPQATRPAGGPIAIGRREWPDRRAELATMGVHPDDAAALAPLLQSRSFEAEQVIEDAGAFLTECHFVLSGVVSITCAQEEGLELGTIAAPGFIGLAVPLGGGGTEVIYPMVARTAVECLSVSSIALEALMAASPRLRLALLRYAGTMLDMVLRRAACHAAHGLEQRIASWLLVNAHKGGEPLRITHETLARLLGARRATVTNALHLLEGERAIYSHRCRLAVRDTERLARFACSCHQTIPRKGEPLRLMG